MREIKFRAWDHQLKKMIEVFELSWFEDTYLVNGVLPCDKPMVYMQYTGLKDKTGKEIYEGDIVKSYESHYHHTYIAEVKFGPWECNCGDYYCDGYGIGWYVVGPNWYERPTDRFWTIATRTLSEYRQKWSVLGNIYEDSELLKDRNG